MRSCRGVLFQKGQFAAEIIVTCVRWYLRFSLSLRDVEQLMAERGLWVDHMDAEVSPEVQPVARTKDPSGTSMRLLCAWMYRVPRRR
jgi:hypothetical protein